MPLEDSSGNRRRLGHITKQGNALLRFLLGPRTALAFVLIIGKADRFPCGQQIASYLGLVPLEDSSGNRRRLGHITKQGNALLRFLLVEAAQVTARSPPGMAQPLRPPDDAAGTENRQGRHGEEAGGSLVLEDAQGMGFGKVNKVRRGKARNRRWCEVEHRAIEWVSRSSSRRSSK